MKDFVYTRERSGPSEWQYTLVGKTPRERRASLKTAAISYERRFRRPLPMPNRLTRIGKTILVAYNAYPIALVEGKATPEPEPEPEPAILQLTLEMCND